MKLLSLFGLVFAYAVSGDGLWAQIPAATPTIQNTQPHVDSLGDPLPPGALLRFGTRRFRYPSSVIELTLSPDDKYVATIGSEWLIVWQADTGQELRRANCRDLGIVLPGASYGIHALAFTPDGSHFYTPGKSGSVFSWESETGTRKTISASLNAIPLLDFRLLLNGSRQLLSVDLGPSGDQIALGGDRGLVVSDLSGKWQFMVPNQPAQPITTDDMNSDRLTFAGDYSYALFSPTEEILAAVLSEAPQEIRLLNTKDGSEIRRIPTTAKVVRMAFAPDGKHLVATERDCGVRQYDVVTGKRVWQQPFEPDARAESYVSAVACSPDGKLIAACAPIGSDHAIYLLEPATGKVVHKLKGHRWKPWAVDFTSDGKTLFSSGWDGNIRRWNVETGAQLPLPQGVQATGRVAASSTEPTLAYLDDRNTIHFVDSDSGNERFQLAIPATSFDMLAFSPDGKRFAAGAKSELGLSAIVWDLAARQIVFRRDWPVGPDAHAEVDSLEFSPDGKQLAASVFRQSTGHLWDLATGNEVAELRHSQIFDLAFSPDGKTLATIGWDSLIQLWDTSGGFARNITMASDAANSAKTNVNANSYGSMSDDWRVESVSFSPAGDLLATTHMNGKLVLWNADEMVPSVVAASPKGSFSQQGMAFSPDGLWLATGHAGGGVTIWDPFAGQPAAFVKEHFDTILEVGFARSSRKLLTGASDGLCYLWDVSQLVEPTAKEYLEALWHDLSGVGEAPFAATWALVDRPADSTRFLAEKLRAAEAPNPITARRALAVLTEINTPAARQVIEETASREPRAKNGRAAKPK